MSENMKNTAALIAAFADDVEGTVNRAVGAAEDRVNERLALLESETAKHKTLRVEFAGKVKDVKGLRHPMLEDAILTAGTGEGVFLYGPAGSGKSYGARQVAEALGLEFYSVSVNAQTSKSDLLGYMNAQGDYVPSIFRMAWETGGLFLMDEVDAGNPNTLSVLNDALSNGVCPFPDGMIPKGDGFRVIAAGNTSGEGADVEYNGRNKLERAFTVRWGFIRWDYDVDFERSLVSWSTHGEAWHRVILAARDLLAKHGKRGVACPRALNRGVALLEAGMKVDRVLDIALTGGIGEDCVKDWRKDLTAAFKGA